METQLVVPNYDDSDEEDTPDIVLSPSVPNAPDKIPCADWKGCAASLGFIVVVGLFGTVCALAGYRYHECNQTNFN